MGKRNVKWRVRFKTRSDKDGVLNLYEDGYDGEVIELEGAPSPFETQEYTSDKWLEPIRKQTGYIRMIDEDNTDGIMPIGMKDRYVEYTEDGVLAWCGYVMPDVFSSDWDVAPRIVEFPVISGLGVLESIYLNEDEGLGVVSLASLLNECLQASGIDYNRIYIPKEIRESETESDYLYPLTLEISRFNYFTENDSLNVEESDWSRYNGETCYDVISSIMNFFGWTIRERGNDIWITSTECEGSVSITIEELSALANDSRTAIDVIDVSRELHDIQSFELADGEHKKDIIQGAKKVVVKASVNPVGEVVPSVDKAKMQLGLSQVNELNLNGDVYAYEKKKQYVPKNGYTDVVLRSYTKATPLEIFDEWIEFKNQIYDMNGMALMPLYVGAYFVEREYVSKDEYKDKKNWNLTESILIKNEGWDFLIPNQQERADMKFLEMRSRNIANYVNGAFVLSATTRCIYLSAGFTLQEKNGAGSIEVKFRVGSKFWNGSGWGTDDVWFRVEMGDESDPENYEGTGKIISTKTLDMPYTGADGYVIPITEPLNGEVELDLRFVYSKMDTLDYQVLENLKVDYYGLDDDEEKSDEDENRYARTTGLNYANEEEISLKMATSNNNKAGYGILSIKGANVEAMHFVEQGMQRPEMNLVRKGVNLYGRNTEKLTLNLEKKKVNPHDILTIDGKVYFLASESVNWAEETSQYIIMEV